MPRKVPYSGKQKKQQLQEKKARKKDGPQYLADWSDDDADAENNAPATSDKELTGGGATVRAPLDKDVQKMNVQPERKTKISVNNFRLQFLKEPDEVIDKRKKEARRPVKRLSENELEYGAHDAYPKDFNLDFPKRPAWNYKMSKEQVEKQEREYFQIYLSDMISQHRSEDLSYFELNLENWRQLWRVEEMADILLIIADIRYPVLHVSPSLLHYIQHTLHKPVILIVNKIDFVSPLMAVAWRRYLEQQFPSVHDVVFFSSSVKKNRHQGKKDKEKNADGENKEDDEDVPLDFDPSKTMFKRPPKGSTVPLGPTDLFKAVAKIVKDKVDLSSWREHLEQEGLFQPEEQMHDHDSGAGGGGRNGSGEGKESQGFKQDYKDGVVTLGCIGYPNVGKSSVLNALKGRTVVSVSQTPGHTKHFQSIFLTPTVKLCDCPGLVFPSVVPKALQVIAGIFPVSQVREPYSVVQYLAERMDLPALLKIRRPSDCVDSDEDEAGYKWSAYDICEAWAVKRGFFTPKASRPDLYRAANNILKMAVSGQIRLCFRPPGYSVSMVELKSDGETQTLHGRLKTLITQQQAEGGDIPEGEENDVDEDEDSNEEEVEENEKDLGCEGL